MPPRSPVERMCANCRFPAIVSDRQFACSLPADRQRSLRHHHVSALQNDRAIWSNPCGWPCCSSANPDPAYEPPVFRFPNPRWPTRPTRPPVPPPARVWQPVVANNEPLRSRARGVPAIGLTGPPARFYGTEIQRHPSCKITSRAGRKTGLHSCCRRKKKIRRTRRWRSDACCRGIWLANRRVLQLGGRLEVGCSACDRRRQKLYSPSADDWPRFDPSRLADVPPAEKPKTARLRPRVFACL